MDSSSFSSSYSPAPPPPPDSSSSLDPDPPATAVLSVHVHHARNIHNICIYANQDVYAKFSLTCSPDAPLSTRVVNGGGRNPLFDQLLRLPLPPRPDPVLKCEIWMLSRAPSVLEDQLLGFALVPLSLVAASHGRRLTQDFTLSSTDLFHSPAGTVSLTLYLDPDPYSSAAVAANSAPISSSSIASEVVILDPEEYRRIEFPDLGVARENQQMVSEYFNMNAAAKPVPFLQLGASSDSMEDYDMTAANSGDDENNAANSGPFSSTATSLSDDRNSSADSMEKKSQEPRTNNINRSPGGASPETPTSKRDEKDSGKEEEVIVDGKHEGEIGSVFKSPLGDINLEAEQSAMQQQIVDMYMRSMQQFTESLAKMKLPMDLDNPKAEDGGDVIQSRSGSEAERQKKKKEGSRVFYGSRAFF